VLVIGLVEEHVLAVITSMRRSRIHQVAIRADAMFSAELLPELSAD
jgi:hypothetical protein